jgi:hypothetical protein
MRRAVGLAVGITAAAALGWHWGDPVLAAPVVVHVMAAKPWPQMHATPALDEILRRAEPADPCELLRCVGRSAEGYQIWERAAMQGLLETLLRDWLASCGEDAQVMQLIDEYPETGVTQRLRELLMEHVTRVHPPAAARWLVTQRQKGERSMLLAAFDRGLQKADLREHAEAWNLAWQDGTLLALQEELDSEL